MMFVGLTAANAYGFKHFIKSGMNMMASVMASALINFVLLLLLGFPLFHAFLDASSYLFVAEPTDPNQPVKKIQIDDLLQQTLRNRR